MSNLKNSLMTIFFCCCQISCKQVEPDYVLVKQMLPITIINGTKNQILDSRLILKRNKKIIDSGNLTIYSYYQNKIDVELRFKKEDTIYRRDSILIYVGNREFTLSDVERKSVSSLGKPFLVNYKINARPFIEREGYLELK